MSGASVLKNLRTNPHRIGQSPHGHRQILNVQVQQAVVSRGSAIDVEQAVPCLTNGIVDLETMAEEHSSIPGNRQI